MEEDKLHELWLKDEKKKGGKEEKGARLITGKEWRYFPTGNRAPPPPHHEMLFIVLSSGA
jgi:hypothetical protein